MKPQIATATATAGLAALTALDYLAFLGWDQAKDRNPVTGAQTGPYETWQVVGCASVLLALGLWAARSGPAALVFVVPLVFTLCWAASASTDPAGDGLWPIGAALVLIGTTVGAACCLVVAGRGRRSQTAP